jgi:Cu(I)/Ag(I) efflux system membrane fusion protein/cobalt-zinc-cadmium efflux system membrane fusion protein
MKNYRKAFYVALIGNIALAAILGGWWWHARRYAARVRLVFATANSQEPSQAKSEPAGTTTSEAALAPVQLSVERLQSIGVKFGKIERKPVQDEIRVTGTVGIDERRVAYVQTRFAGHIESVFADATYQYVRKGQPLFTIHSPELVAAEREYLVAAQNAKRLSNSSVPDVAAGTRSLLESSRERLMQWDVPDTEIARLESSGEAVEALEITSPVSGYITERNALPNLMVQPETRLYTIADLSTVWVLAQVFQNDLGRIKTGMSASVTVDAYEGRTFRGRVDFVYPEVDMATRTVKVRLVIANENLLLKPGMFVNATFQVPMGTQLVIPASGALQSGTRQVVFVDHGEGNLEPREVQLGPMVNEQYVVLKGLKEGERIVTSANFLLDSESQLQAALGTYMPPPPGTGTAAAADTAQASMEFSSVPAPPHKGANQFQIRLTDAQGKVITNAEVTATFFMSGMPEMGMAAVREEFRLADKGEGIYAGSGNLPNSGNWNVTLLARKNGQVVASKQFTMNAPGGM